MEKQGWLTLAIAALGIIGTLLGSVVQNSLSVEREKSKEFEDRRREAYVNFLEALDKERVASSKNADAKLLLEQANKEKMAAEQAETLRKEAKALQEKAKELKTLFELEAGAALRLIAVYGDKEVVVSWANYSRALDEHYKDGDESYGPCAPTWQEDVLVYQAIRNSSMGWDQAVDPIDLAHSALFCNPDKNP